MSDSEWPDREFSGMRQVFDAAFVTYEGGNVYYRGDLYGTEEDFVEDVEHRRILLLNCNTRKEQ